MVKNGVCILYPFLFFYNLAICGNIYLYCIIVVSASYVKDSLSVSRSFGQLLKSRPVILLPLQSSFLSFLLLERSSETSWLLLQLRISKLVKLEVFNSFKLLFLQYNLIRLVVLSRFNSVRPQSLQLNLVKAVHPFKSILVNFLLLWQSINVSSGFSPSSSPPSDNTPSAVRSETSFFESLKSSFVNFVLSHVRIFKFFKVVK